MLKTSRSIHPSVLTLTMDRATKRNALSGPLVRQLTAAIRDADADTSVRVVVLTGEGSAFSAGADLEALQRLQEANFEHNLDDSLQLAGLFDAIDSCAKPIIARVNGHAIAGGCGLASACDFSIAVRGAKFGFTEVRIGFVPALVSVFLARRIPELHLRKLLLTGRLISAAEAVRIGLISECTPDDKLDDTVTELALELVRETSAQAISQTKQLMRDLRGLEHADALQLAARANARARGTDDCLSGVAAFLSKSDPPWKAGFGSAD